VITQIFRVSVDPHVMSNVQGQRLIFLPGVNEELNAAGAPLKLTIDVLEQAIMEAANTWPHDKPLMSYLLPCWKRAVSASNSAKTATGVRQEVHEEAKRLCMSNCLFALTMPDLYGLVICERTGSPYHGQHLTHLQARAEPCP
jgi:ubiquitin conjugation factor E4 B